MLFTSKEKIVSLRILKRNYSTEHNLPGVRFDVSGGRMSVSGIIATVFGCTGFLGHYVVNELGRHGSQIVVPYRGEESSINALKVMGDLGQIVPTKWAINDKDSIRRAVQHSNVIINCTGRRWDTRNFKMSQVHVDGARLIAEVAKEEGIKHLIHVSAIPSQGSPPSDWFKSKADGEAVVRSTFPNAVIIRPATIWGAQDEFIRHHATLMKYWPIYPLVHPDRQIQPVYVDNVAQAIIRALISADSFGKIFEVAGPDVVTTKQFAEWIRLVLKMPDKRFYEAEGELLWHLGYWLGQHRHPRFTLDSIKESSNVIASNKFPGLTELGIKPMRVKSEFSLSFLHPFRHPSRHNDVTTLLEEIPELETITPGGQVLY
jgi:uncharacterized protein YbjT (DUF2867 family)